MKEVFIAKNGRPYVKDENGKVRFISSTEWKEYQSNTNASNRGKYLMVVIFIALVTVYAANNIGVLL